MPHARTLPAPSRRHLLGAALAGACTHALPQAQAYPAKPVTLVVAYPAGGDTDALARIFAEKLSQRTGQPVLVDNRPGASGAIGSAYVAHANADGHTLLLAPQTLAVSPLVLKLSPGVDYDPTRDFEPVVELGTNPLLLAGAPGDGPRTFAQLLALARSGKRLTYASPGVGSPMHVAAEVLNRDAGIKITHIPYRGVAPALVDLMGGQVSVAWLSPGAAAQQLASGKVTPLAVSGTRRAAALPQVPTFAELGYAGVDIVPWYGILGPRNLPAGIVAMLNQHLNEILRLPDVAEKMRGLGIAPSGGAPAALRRSVEADWRKFGRLVKEFDIQAD